MYVYKSILNKRSITFPVVIYCHPFASNAVFWAILKDFEFAKPTRKKNKGLLESLEQCVYFHEGNGFFPRYNYVLSKFHAPLVQL